MGRFQKESRVPSCKGGKISQQWPISKDSRRCKHVYVCVCARTVHVLLKWRSQIVELFHWTVLQLPTLQMFPFGSSAAAGQMLQHTHTQNTFTIFTFYRAIFTLPHLLLLLFRQQFVPQRPQSCDHFLFQANSVTPLEETKVKGQPQTRKLKNLLHGVAEGPSCCVPPPHRRCRCCWWNTTAGFYGCWIWNINTLVESERLTLNYGGHSFRITAAISALLQEQGLIKKQQINLQFVWKCLKQWLNHLCVTRHLLNSSLSSSHTSVHTPPWPCSILPPAPFWGRQEDRIKPCPGQMWASLPLRRISTHTQQQAAAPGACERFTLTPNCGPSQMLSDQDRTTDEELLICPWPELLKGQFSPNIFLRLILTSVCGKVWASDQQSDSRSEEF